MTRGAKGCLFAAMGIFLVLLVLVVAATMTGGIRQGSVLTLTVSGEIVEDRDDSLLARLLGDQPTMLRDLTFPIDRARSDSKVDGLIVVIKPFQMGMGKIQELRDTVKEFRAAGKWACAYLDTAGEFGGGNAVYYLATAFDEIWLSPAGDVNLIALFGSTTFLRGTFDKLGIYPEFDSIGKYKNAKNLYTEKKYTDAHREATTAFLSDWQAQIRQGIVEGRSLPADEVQKAIDEGPFTGDEALARRLVDHLGYRDEFDAAMEERNGGDLNLLKGSDYLNRKGSGSGRRRIAVLTGQGLVVVGKSSMDPMTGYMMGSDSLREAFEEAAGDDRIDAIVFRVDSPGGSAIASDIIWRSTQLARKRKPVVISMSDLAASGGYYVSAGATRIVTQPGTLTGSIGVVAGKMVTTGLYDWIGLSRDEIELGPHAGYYYDGRRYSPEEKEIYWKFMNKVYSQFTARVAEGRGMTREAVDAIGQGRVWTGARAKELGLVDELGGLRTAIGLARKEAGIPEDESVRLVYLPEKKTFLQNLLFSEEEAASARAVLPPEAKAVIRQLSRIAILQREGVWLLAEPGLE